MYVRRSGDRELTFDFAEGLIKNNLLIVDRETDSVWSQLENQAISGPMKGTPLTVVPSIQSTWKFWRTVHPDTKVAIVKGKPGRPYRYVGARRTRIKAGDPLPKHDVSQLGLGLSRNHEALFLPFRELDKGTSPFHIRVGGTSLQVHYRPDGVTAWAEDETGHVVSGVIAYRKGWMAFNPDSKIYHVDSQVP